MDNMENSNDDLLYIRKCLLNGEYEEGINYCKNIKKKFETDSNYWIILGDLYNINEQYKKAIKSYELAYLLSLNKSTALIKLIEPYLRIGDYNRAGIYCARAVSLGEIREETGRKLGEICANPQCSPLGLLEICKILENSEFQQKKILDIIKMMKKGIVLKIMSLLENEVDLKQSFRYFNILDNLGIRKISKKIENMRKKILKKEDIKRLKNSEDKYFLINLSFSESDRYSLERLKNSLMICTILLKKKNYQEAYNFCIEALKIADVLKDSKNKKLLLILKVQLLNILGGLDLIDYHYYDALIKYEEALKHSLELELTGNIANSLNYLGVISLIKREYDLALEKCNKAVEIIEKSPNQSNKSIYINCIGKVHYKLGNYARALEKFQHAIELAKSQNNHSTIALTLNNIGKVYHKQGDSTRALDLLKNALETLNEHNLENSKLGEKIKLNIESLKNKMI
ncbi:MAG: tetratricopeptide repeat protein [Promethearchaeota archaeon]|nr:MAG: tetratricopeptide repeat protein [Candidatus Lokiarchaeota archaeon]